MKRILRNMAKLEHLKVMETKELNLRSENNYFQNFSFIQNNSTCISQNNPKRNNRST